VAKETEATSAVPNEIVRALPHNSQVTFKGARVVVGSMRAKKLIPCQANTTNSERARQTMPKRYA
jgi:hypothetical protein